MVNVLVGRNVGAVGHYARGTERLQRYRAVLDGREFDVIDLPGLGDAKEQDRLYKPMYASQVRLASGVIIVVTPPRPAALPTQRSVRQVLRAGFPARRIVFAFNRVTMLNVASDGALFPIEIDENGPASDDDMAAVDQAVHAFITDLTGHIGVRFCVNQVVPCDAMRGWNTRETMAAALAVPASHR